MFDLNVCEFCITQFFLLNLHMILDILELRVKTKINLFKIWAQILSRTTSFGLVIRERFVNKKISFFMFCIFSQGKLGQTKLFSQKSEIIFAKQFVS